MVTSMVELKEGRRLDQLPSGVFTIQGERDHRTFRVSAIMDDPNKVRFLEVLGPEATWYPFALVFLQAPFAKVFKRHDTSRTFQAYVKLLVLLFVEGLREIRIGDQMRRFTVMWERVYTVCGRPLTTPDSIETGVGPICRSKL